MALNPQMDETSRQDEDLPAAREWLTVEQAADYLQLSQSSIRSYIRQGRLDAKRIGGLRKVLIHRNDLLKLLEPARGGQLDD